MIRIIWKAVAVVALAAGSAGAVAQQPVGPYLGLLAGSADIAREVTDDYTYKTDKATWGAMVGWQLHPNFAVEVGYLKPRNLRETITDGADTESITGSLHGWTATGLLTWPFSERWSAHARVGAVRGTEKYSATLNGAPYGSFADNTTDVIYGGGLGVMLEGARLRVEYQRAEFKYGKVGILSIGINWFLPVGN